MEAFGKTLRNWHKEIVNSFIVFKHSYTVDKETGQVVVSAQKMNTGVLENRNSILKAIKKNSNGYTNWERFRNRCLYILRKNAVPLLHPIEDKQFLFLLQKNIIRKRDQRLCGDATVNGIAEGYTKAGYGAVQTAPTAHKKTAYSSFLYPDYTQSLLTYSFTSINIPGVNKYPQDVYFQFLAAPSNFRAP